MLPEKRNNRFSIIEELLKKCFKLKWGKNDRGGLNLFPVADKTEIGITDRQFLSGLHPEFTTLDGFHLVDGHDITPVNTPELVSR